MESSMGWYTFTHGLPRTSYEHTLGTLHVVSSTGPGLCGVQIPIQFNETYHGGQEMSKKNLNLKKN